MAKFNDDDFLDGLDDWDDDDLLLLDMDEGSMDSPSGGSKRKGSGNGKVGGLDDFGFEPMVDDWDEPTKPANPPQKQRKKKGHGGLVALIVILVVLIVAVAIFLVALKRADGKLSNLAFWNNSIKVTQTTGNESSETSSPIESETVTAESEATESESVEPSESSEVSEEPLEVESESESTEVDLTGLALLELWGEDFTPDLVGVNNVGAAQADETLGTLDSSAATHLADFIAAARAEGYNTVRSTAYQEATADSTDEALEHATGLAVDLADTNQWILTELAGDETFADELAWWAENAAEYGFILRYPEDKEDITGVEYKPYHFVYVGTTIAQEMAENDWCLEEYLENQG